MLYKLKFYQPYPTNKHIPIRIYEFYKINGKLTCNIYCKYFQYYVI